MRYVLYISGEEGNYALDKKEFQRIAKELYGGEDPFDESCYEECDIFDIEYIVSLIGKSAQPRLRRAFEDMNIHTLKEFFDVSLEKFMCMRNIGKKTIDELITRLAEHHIVLTGNQYTSPKNRYFEIED